jgi:hypothetical protein
MSEVEWVNCPLPNDGAVTGQAALAKPREVFWELRPALSVEEGATKLEPDLPKNIYAKNAIKRLQWPGKLLRLATGEKKPDTSHGHKAMRARGGQRHHH